MKRERNEWSSDDGYLCGRGTRAGEPKRGVQTEARDGSEDWDCDGGPQRDETRPGGERRGELAALPPHEKQEGESG